MNMDFTIPKGNSFDSFLKQLHDYIPSDYAWFKREKLRESGLVDGDIVVVKSNYANNKLATVIDYPNGLLLQDMDSNSDEGMKNRKGEVFTVTAFRKVFVG